VETIHYFLKRYVEDMRARPVSQADLERHIADYERTLRAGMLREAELAAMAERHQELASNMALAAKLLPMARSDHEAVRTGA
jgi:hypothetical protein